MLMAAYEGHSDTCCYDLAEEACELCMILNHSFPAINVLLISGACIFPIGGRLSRLVEIRRDPCMVADIISPQSSENQPEEIRLYLVTSRGWKAASIGPQLQPYLVEASIQTPDLPADRPKYERQGAGAGSFNARRQRSRRSRRRLRQGPVFDRDVDRRSRASGLLPDVREPGGPGLRRPRRQTETGDSDRTTGLIYRGLPGTRLSATDDHVRMAI